MTEAAHLRSPRAPRVRRRTLAVALALSALVGVAAVGCSSDSGDGASSDTSEKTTTTTAPEEETVSRPDGPVATISGPMTGGKGMFLGAAAPPEDLEGKGYAEDEYLVEGTAGSYIAEGPFPTDGKISVTDGPTANYATRIVVRRPADPADFNGTVVVEWLNVSGGVDAGPDYTYLEAELLRQGYAWVGVSAQRIGVEGGPVAVEAPGAEEAGAGKGLKGIDPERYGDLDHPGDAYAYDMYTQVARALREPGDTDPLDGLEVDQVLAIGESQSAFALTTYYNAIQPVTEAFDGFFIHSRGGAAMPLSTDSGYVAIADSIGGAPVQLRTDLDAPALTIETETDVLSILGFYPARQPDTDTIHTWEIAGTAHADAFQIGDGLGSLGCPTDINRGQQVFVLRAGLRALQAWVTDETAPPTGEPLTVDDSEDGYILDDLGIATGGIRTPSVDAPSEVLSGQSGAGASVLCLLLGSTTPIPPDQLAALYDDRDDYLAQYEATTDAAIDAGFMLAEDRDAIIDDANPDLIPG